jgi:hypothetical protein
MSQRVKFIHTAEGTLDMEVTDLDEQGTPLKTIRYYNCTCPRNDGPLAWADEVKLEVEAIAKAWGS